MSHLFCPALSEILGTLDKFAYTCILYMLTHFVVFAMFITDMAHVTLYVVSLEQQSCSQGIYWDCVPRHSMHDDSEEMICVGHF